MPRAWDVTIMAPLPELSEPGPEREERGEQGPAQSCVFSARLRHYLQSEEIIHADYQGVSPPSQPWVLRLHWIKITGPCHLAQGREVGLVSVEHQTFTQTYTETHSSLTNRLLQNFDKA